MKIAITGAGGFVGTHLTQRLEADGHELVLMSRRARTAEPRIMVDPLVPTRRFTSEQIRSGLPHRGPFSIGDLRWCS